MSAHNASRSFLFIASAMLAVPYAFAQGAAMAAPAQHSQTTVPPATAPVQPISAAIGSVKPIPFEVVSIRENISQRVSGLRFTADGFSTEGSSVLRLLSMWGNISTTGLQGWCSTVRYDIAAKVAETDIASWQKLGSKERNLSIRALMEDRFKLKWHIETKMEPGFELVIAKNGSKLKEATPGEAYPTGPKETDGTPRHGVFLNGVGPMGFVGQAATMDQLTRSLRMFAEAPVVDKTGLTGTYDFTLIATRLPPPGNSDPPVNDIPFIFSAVQQQLGLKLVSAKVPVETLVVDYIERPSAN